MKARIAGAILAGGASSRMGRPKEGVPLSGGLTMIEHVLGAFAGVVDLVVVAGDCTGFSVSDRANVVHVNDRHRGVGPLGGIEAVLASGVANGYVVATCDQPLLTPDVLRTLSGEADDRAAFLRTEGGLELDPFPGYFPATLHGSVRAAIDAERLSVRGLIRTLNVRWLTIADTDAACLRSIDTPEDLRGL